MEFTEDQIHRYSRHILLQDVGVEGQEKISNGRVLIVGAGGLGAPVALYLAAAGVGTIGIIDGDVVDLSNLQRQVIHFTPDVNKAKVLSAKEKISQLNPDVNVITYYELLTASNALEIIKDYDFVVDGTDNFPVKFLINDACVKAGKPFSHGGILRFDGQTITVLPGTACYRCVFHAPPPPKCRTNLFAGWSSGCHRRNAGNHSGNRSFKIPYRCRRSVDQPSSNVQCQKDGVSYNQCETQSTL